MLNRELKKSTYVEIYATKDNDTSELFDWVLNHTEDQMSRINVYSKIPRKFSNKQVPILVAKNSVWSQSEFVPNEPISNACVTMDNWILKTSTINSSQMIRFLSSLSDNNHDLELETPCLLFYGRNEDWLDVRNLVKSIQKTMNYHLYMCRKGNNHRSVSNEMKRKELGEYSSFQLAIVERIGRDKEMSISFGLVREMYDYVQARVLSKSRILADKFKRPEKVSGLKSVNFYESKQENKRILVLGEEHSRKGVCLDHETSFTNADDFFIGLLEKNKGIIVDVFGEFDISMYGQLQDRRDLSRKLNERHFAHNSFLHSVRRRLTSHGCLFEDRKTYRKCPYRNHVRFHSGDIRNTRILSLMFFESVFMVSAHIAKFTASDRDMSDLSAYESALLDVKKFISNNFDELCNFNAIDTLSNELDSLVSELKIRTQVDNIGNELIKNTINGQLGAFLTKVRVDMPANMFSTFARNVLDLSVGKPDFDVACGSVFEINARLGYIGENLMDFYIMSRIFSAVNKKPGIIDAPVENIVVYVGDSHAQKYRDILLSVGFHTVYSSVSKDGNMCLDISALMWPYTVD